MREKNWESTHWVRGRKRTKKSTKIRMEEQKKNLWIIYLHASFAFISQIPIPVFWMNGWNGLRFYGTATAFEAWTNRECLSFRCTYICGRGRGIYIRTDVRCCSEWRKKKMKKEEEEEPHQWGHAKGTTISTWLNRHIYYYVWKHMQWMRLCEDELSGMDTKETKKRRKDGDSDLIRTN